MSQEVSDAQMRDLYFYAKERINNGVRNEVVCKGLVSKGLDPGVAKTMVAEISDVVRKKQRSNAKANMIMGAIWSLGGLAATIASYRFSVPGGHYGIFWGAMVFGTLEFIYGLNKYSSR